MLEALAYAGRAGRAIAADPYEGVQRVVERAGEWRDHRRPPPRYHPTEGCERRLHERLGLSWPCLSQPEFDRVWDEATAAVASAGLALGRGAFGGWDDGDGRLGRLAWCLTRHRQPERVVETGVGRGLTTRVVLEALERNGSGHLWSIDLPPLIERDLEQQTGIAVPGRLRHRWTLLRGSSRRQLPGLAVELGSIDLFLHDSLHTERNVSFELRTAWAALAPGGAALLDDIQQSAAFGRFTPAAVGASAIVCAADDGEALIGCLLKPQGAA
jgi:hypothetical protein